MTAPAPGPSAASITVAETLGLLTEEFRSMAKGVADGEYAFWLGSGIARGRVPGLEEVIVKVLMHLHGESSDADDCPYRRALEEAVSLIDLRKEELDRTDLGISPTDWPDRDAVVKGLVSS